MEGTTINLAALGEAIASLPPSAPIPAATGKGSGGYSPIHTLAQLRAFALWLLMPEHPDIPPCLVPHPYGGDAGRDRDVLYSLCLDTRAVLGAVGRGEPLLPGDTLPSLVYVGEVKGSDGIARAAIQYAPSGKATRGILNPDGPWPLQRKPPATREEWVALASQADAEAQEILRQAIEQAAAGMKVTAERRESQPRHDRTKPDARVTFAS